MNGTVKLEQRVVSLSNKIMRVLDGERADVGVMACIQACVTIARQEAAQAGEPTDAISALEKIELALEAIKETERAAGVLKV